MGARSESKSVEKTSAVSWAIFLVSVAGLFLEMMLIRWIGTEIRIFAYLQNTILIVCFLGLGMGCFTCRQPIRLNRSFACLFVLTTILAVPFFRHYAAKISQLLSSVGDSMIWNSSESTQSLATITNVAAGLLMTFGLMVIVWEIFVPIGRLLGRAMADHPKTIKAYSINVGGSLIGIWLFVLASAIQTPPYVWLIAVATMLGYFILKSSHRRQCISFACFTILTAFCFTDGPKVLEVVWSPYQKLSYVQLDGELSKRGQASIMVNNTGYQGLYDLSQEGIESNSLADKNDYLMTQYDVPLHFVSDPAHVLIVGAGSGNDVAGALRGGAQKITAVEIDPAIIQLGKKHHPERPYDSPKVRVINDDARSHFATANDKYDLIIFGLLDSHTTTAMTNARLDHYVYTRESISRAKSLLSENGVMVLSFEAAKPFIADRMARCIAEVFDTKPLSFKIPENTCGWGGVMFVAGHQPTIDKALATNQQLAEKIEYWQTEYPLDLTYSTKVASDDWPYIYLETPWVPSLYFFLVVLMIGLAYYGQRRLAIPGLFSGWKSSNWHFFFLGAAFLLLEVQNISKASVVLGNTWVVNAVIISAILSMILISNLIVSYFPNVSSRGAATCLIVSCFGLYFFDISSLAFLPFATKAILLGLITTLPMLFSGIIFIKSYAQVEQKDQAIGANLIGALVGGMLKSITFAIGIKALLLIVAGLYGAALILSPSRSRAIKSLEKESESFPRLVSFESSESAEMEVPATENAEADEAVLV